MEKQKPDNCIEAIFFKGRGQWFRVYFFAGLFPDLVTAQVYVSKEGKTHTEFTHTLKRVLLRSGGQEVIKCAMIREYERQVKKRQAEAKAA